MEPFARDTAAQMEELALSAPVVEALMDLVLDFQTAFSREKSPFPRPSGDCIPAPLCFIMTLIS